MNNDTDFLRVEDNVCAHNYGSAIFLLVEILREQQREINDLKAKLATTAEEANRAARAVTPRKYHASPGSAYKPSKLFQNMERMRNTSQFDDTNLPGMYELLYRSCYD